MMESHVAAVQHHETSKFARGEREPLTEMQAGDASAE